MPKICLVGAGSTVFAQNILGDVLSSQRGGDYVISLFDIDPERLKTSEIVARRICESLKLSNVRIDATLDRREALRGSDFVILMMQVGGYKPATVTDFDIPKNMACVRRSPTPLASAAFSAVCGRYQSLRRSAETCRRSAHRLF